jgi:hypothetical protein
MGRHSPTSKVKLKPSSAAQAQQCGSSPAVRLKPGNRKMECPTIRNLPVSSLREGSDMNLIYNSEQYSVVEFGPDRDLESLRFGGYEIVDKGGKREIFIAGVLAQNFRRDVNQLIANEPTMEEIDEFLGNYDSLMSQPVLLH